MGIKCSIWKVLGSISSGHRLMDYQGKCAYLHGHNYSVSVRLVGDPDTNGMIADFGDVKRLRAPLQVYDHKMILSDEDPLARMIPPEHLILIKANPTVENLALLWLGKMEKYASEQQLFGKNVTIAGIYVGETDTSTAIVERDERHTSQPAIFDSLR